MKTTALTRRSLLSCAAGALLSGMFVGLLAAPDDAEAAPPGKIYDEKGRYQGRVDEQGREYDRKIGRAHV